MSIPSTKEALLTLTREEVTVLYLTCMGVNYEEIGYKLAYSEHWVQAHMSNVYVKLGFNLDWHWTKRRKLLKGEYCPALNEMIKSRADIETWPPDPNPPVPNDRALVLVIEDERKRQKKEGGKEKIIDGDFKDTTGEEYIGPDQIAPGPRPEGGEQGRDRGLCVVAGLAFIAIVACVIAALAIYGYISRTPTTQTVAVPQTVVVVATQVAPQSSDPIVQPTDVPIPTFTPIASQSDQVPPPGSPLPAGGSYSKNGIVASTSPSFRYASAAEYFDFYVYITNHRNSDYILRSQGKFIHLTDDTGMEYAREICCGDSAETVTTVRKDLRLAFWTNCHKI